MMIEDSASHAVTDLAGVARRLTSLRHPVIATDLSVQALITAPIPPDGYVWPDLRDWDKAEGSRILLIQAPGAVGKSAAARALASSLNWPLVDTSKAQVGSYSLSGLVQDSLGFDSDFLRDISAGTAGIVIDALDEAHLRAGTANFHAFLENVRRIAGDPIGLAPSVVLFSRPDTARVIARYYSEENVALDEAILDFFTLPQAGHFIDAYMDEQSKKSTQRPYSIAKGQPKPFADLRDLRMKQIASALLGTEVDDLITCWREVSSFLGYAPVLAVLGEFLAVNNPFAAKEESLDLGTGSGGILSVIIERLLTREGEKFSTQISYKLQSEVSGHEEWPNDVSLYSPDEQSVRLAGRILGSDVTGTLPADLPPSVRESYDKHVNQFIDDHPFLAGTDAVNVVFKDYILARASIDPLCAASLERIPQESAAESGPFFYQFVASFASVDPETENPCVPEDLVVPLIYSHASAGFLSEAPYYIYVHNADQDYARLVLFHRSFGRTDDFEFQVQSPAGVLHFPRELSRGIIFSEGAVILGNPHSSFILGPVAIVSVGELVIDAELVSVEPSANFPNVTSLLAKRIEISGPLRLNVPVRESLQVATSTPWPQLHPFMIELDLPDPTVPFAGYMDLRAILRFFKQGAGASPSVFDEKLDQGIVKSNPRRKKYLDKLRNLGIVTHQKSHYYLDTGKLSAHGIDIRSIGSGEPTKEMLKFIEMLETSAGTA